MDGSPLVQLGPALVVALAVGIAVAAAVGASARLGTGAAVLRAAARAVVQLGAVALLLEAIVGSLPASLGFVALMTAVAAGTAARRLTPHHSGWWATVPVAGGALPVIGSLAAAGVVPIEGVAIIAVAGIVIGAAMTATVLAGRRGLDDLIARRGEYEAGLSLGLSPRDAAAEIVRPAAAAALIPPLDQTRTVGLVTLPGAFVGMLLGGASPAEAAAVQLLVLVSVVAAATVAVAVLVELIATGRIVRPSV